MTRREEPSNGSRRSPDGVAPIAGSEPLDAEAFRSAFEDAPIGMSFVDVAPGRMGQFVRVNAALAELTGYSREAMIGMDYADVTVPEDVDKDHARMRELIDGAIERYQIEKRYVHARGHVAWVIVTVSLVRSRAGAALYAIRQVMDISARKQFEGQLEHLADHDPLTGLFNRRRFDQELSRQLAYARRYGGGGVVAMLDLDHMKEINDTFGHRVGDEALITAAHLLRDRLRATDVVARLGGDEFAIALPHTDQRHAQAVLEDLLRGVREDSGVIVSQDRPLTVSIGMTLFGEDPEAGGTDLMVLADVAMYEAKARGGDACVVYDAGVAVSGQARIARQSWSTRIRDALDRDTFELYGQPIIDLQTGKIVQRETLLRMRDGEDLVLPGAFLYIAERFGLAHELDRWVIHHALHQIAGRPGELLTINLSGDSVTDAEIPDYLERELDASAHDPQSVVIEVTETAAIANMDRARTFVTQIKNLGCKIALDDFGAGFGSFYYLKYLPLDFLKIDGEFISHLPASRTDQILVEAIVTMAHGLGQQVIAEHVQDAATVQILRRLGADHAQGYHLGRPAPITEPVSSGHDAR